MGQPPSKEEASSQDSPTATATGTGGAPAHTLLSKPLQQRLQHIHFNMKVVIRGDTAVGKTQLFRRLQNLPFDPKHIPTPQIQCATIDWTPAGEPDTVVKVEVWDVVDHGQRRAPPCVVTGSGLQGKAGRDALAAAEASTWATDAESVDVYRNAVAAILVVDLTRIATLQYAERCARNLPATVPHVAVVGNFFDEQNRRAVHSDELMALTATLKALGHQACYLSSSMSNGYGLHRLSEYLNLPFLRLKQDVLTTQLQETQRRFEELARKMDQPTDAAEDYIPYLTDGKSTVVPTHSTAHLLSLNARLKAQVELPEDDSDCNSQSERAADFGQKNDSFPTHCTTTSDFASTFQV
eukprot:NODE_676_length_1426_cov_162.269426_g512_i0.p1 GENE.NODE_676_length_1426_cov_162.269426_g512_i0~~NODE_676_length_1426_cov_162.269426_g512_i0.p1  ORF type:complete len:353 (+),score=80.74 NODE_676_length_1426_cov_162.269426_g512_i0:127-1185(+)